MILPKTFINSNDITYVSDTFYTFDYRNFPDGDLIFLNNAYILSLDQESMIQTFNLIHAYCKKLKLEYPFKQIKII